MIHVRTIATLIGLAAISLASLFLGQIELAAFTAGALVSYLARVNGSLDAESRPRNGG